MKIKLENQNLMVIKDRNFVGFFVGGIFTLLGLLVIIKPDFFTNNPPTTAGLAGISVGLFVIFASQITTITLDKPSQKMVFTKKSIFRKESKEYNLNSIKQLELRQNYVSSHRTGSGISYKLVFILDNNEEVSLDPHSSSIIRILGKQIIPEDEIGTKISNFLNIPFEKRRPPTVNEMLSAIQTGVQNSIRSS